MRPDGGYVAMSIVDLNLTREGWIRSKRRCPLGAALEQAKEGSELGGTKVKITGTGFSGVTGVRFGATKAKSFSVKSETEIEAVSPAGRGAPWPCTPCAGTR